MPSLSAAQSSGQPPSAADLQSLAELQQIDQRVANIGWKLLTASLRFCPKTRPATGLSLHAASQYAPRFRRAAELAFKLDPVHPSALAVAQGSPAQVAGLLPNDIITAINGRDTAHAPAAASAGDTYADVDIAMDALETLPRESPVNISILRNGHAITFSVAPQDVCPSRVEVAPSGELNSSANGKVARVDGAMALWVHSDDELALVIGHEVAHNILGHPERIEREHIGTGALSSLGASGRKLRDMEREADKLGTWMAALAGYNYRLAPHFWSSITSQAGLGAFLATTHPAASDRRAAALATVRDIDAQLAANPSPAKHEP